MPLNGFLMSCGLQSIIKSVKYNKNVEFLQFLRNMTGMITTMTAVAVIGHEGCCILTMTAVNHTCKSLKCSHTMTAKIPWITHLWSHSIIFSSL